MKKKILITGGNGDIAKAISRELQSSFEVVAPSHEELDVTNPCSIRCFFSFNNVFHALINCAGLIKPNPLLQVSFKEFADHFSVNTFAPFELSQMVLSRNPKAFIINVGSTSAFEGRENWGAYCASKAALMSLIETLAREGYRCWGLHPSRTQTKMREKLFPTEDKNTLMSPKYVASFVPRILAEEFPVGSHLIIRKDKYQVIPMRECPK